MNMNKVHFNLMVGKQPVQRAATPSSATMRRQASITDLLKYKNQN